MIILGLPKADRVYEIIKQFLFSIIVPLFIQNKVLMRSISDGVVRQRRGRLEKSPMMTASPLVFGRSLRQSSAVEEEPSNWVLVLPEHTW